MRGIREFFVIAAVVMLSACASSHAVVGTTRSPIPVELVRIYLTPPAHFETVAMLEAPSKGALSSTAPGKGDPAMERLKKEAAALGANGIVLQAKRND